MAAGSAQPMRRTVCTIGRCRGRNKQLRPRLFFSGCIVITGKNEVLWRL